MTQEDIIKLAREAGLAEGIADGLNGEWKAEREFLERFAALVAAHEREACAKVAEQSPYEDERMFSIAQAIRSRVDQ